MNNCVNNDNHCYYSKHITDNVLLCQQFNNNHCYYSRKLLTMNNCVNDNHCYYSRKFLTMNYCVNNSMTTIAITTETYWQHIVSTIQRHPLLLQQKLTDSILCQLFNDIHCYYSRNLLTSYCVNYSTTTIVITAVTYWHHIVSTIQRHPLLLQQ